MKIVSLTVLLTCVLSLLLAAASGSDRITGYLSDSGDWELGASFEAMDLEGFHLADKDENILEEVWEDSLRTIQFGGVKADVQVRLFFKAGELETIIINVPKAEMSFANLKKHYAKQLAKCQLSDSGDGYSEWADKQDHGLSLTVYESDDLGSITEIGYWRRRAPVEGQAND